MVHELGSTRCSTPGRGRGGCPTAPATGARGCRPRRCGRAAVGGGGRSRPARHRGCGSSRRPGRAARGRRWTARRGAGRGRRPPASSRPSPRAWTSASRGSSMSRMVSRWVGGVPSACRVSRLDQLSIPREKNRPVPRPGCGVSGSASSARIAGSRQPHHPAIVVRLRRVPASTAGDTGPSTSRSSPLAAAATAAIGRKAVSPTSSLPSSSRGASSVTSTGSDPSGSTRATTATRSPRRATVGGSTRMAPEPTDPLGFCVRMSGERQTSARRNAWGGVATDGWSCGSGSGGRGSGRAARGGRAARRRRRRAPPRR